MNKRLNITVTHFLGNTYEINDFTNGLPNIRVNGNIGANGINQYSADLLDIATTIFFVEKALRGSQATNRVLNIKIRLTLRAPEIWDNNLISKLSDLLFFMGGIHWEFRFIKDKKLKIPEFKTSNTRKIELISLFSGGLDSFCGATTLQNTDEVAFVTYYSTQNKELQKRLLKSLNLSSPIQFSFNASGFPSISKSFFYRSFLFFTLAGIVGRSFHATKVLQYENGILASSLAPSYNGRPTKHAHYKVHRYFEEIFSTIFNETWKIENPFRLKTKKEIYEIAQKNLGYNKARILANKTVSCWNLYAGFKDSKTGKIKKNGKPCGFCVPCLIRQTAIRTRDWKNLKNDYARNHIIYGRYFREYYSLIDRVLSLKSESLSDFYKNLDTDYYDVIKPNGDYTPEELRQLLTRFAVEFIETFELR